MDDDQPVEIVQGGLHTTLQFVGVAEQEEAVFSFVHAGFAALSAITTQRNITLIMRPCKS